MKEKKCSAYLTALDTSTNSIYQPRIECKIGAGGVGGGVGGGGVGGGGGGGERIFPCSPWGNSSLSILLTNIISIRN